MVYAKFRKMIKDIFFYSLCEERNSSENVLPNVLLTHVNTHWETAQALFVTCLWPKQSDWVCECVDKKCITFIRRTPSLMQIFPKSLGEV